MAKQPTPDEIARSMGFHDAATYQAWQARQQEIQQLPAQTMSSRQQPTQSQNPSWLDTILSYLPLGSAMQKAGNAMDGKKK